MATYTNRTCTFCGVRKPQPDMRQMKLKMQVGESRPSASGATLLGAMMDNKKSQRALQGAIFNAGARKHYRTKNVWLCTGEECQAEAKKLAKKASGDVSLGFLAVPAIAFFAFVGIFGDDESQGPSTVTAQVVPQVQASSAPAPTYTFQDEIAETDVFDEAATPDTALTQDELDRIEAEFRGAQAQSRSLIQRKLSERGLYRGEIDGLFGAGTLTALVEAARLAKQANPGVSLEDSPSVRALFDMIVLDRL